MPPENTEDEEMYHPPPDLSAVHIYRLQNEEILETLKYELKGYELDGKKWIRKEGRQWMNDDGVAKVISIVRMYGLNKNNILGFLEEDQVKERCRLLWMKLAALFAVRYYRYEIDKATRSILVGMVVMPVHSALSRSLYGKEAKQLSSMASIQEHYLRQDKPRPKDEGILGRFGRREV